MLVHGPWFHNPWSRVHILNYSVGLLPVQPVLFTLNKPEVWMVICWFLSPNPLGVVWMRRASFCTCSDPCLLQSIQTADPLGRAGSRSLPPPFKRVSLLHTTLLLMLILRL